MAAFVQNSIGKEYNVLKALSVSARKAQHFKELETQLIEVANKELQFGDDFRHAMDQCFPDGNVKVELEVSSVLEIMGKFKNFMKFRAGAVDRMQEFLVRWFVDAARGITTSSNTPKEAVDTLKVCLTNLEVFAPTTPAMGKIIAAARSDAEEKLESLQGHIAITHLDDLVREGDADQFQESIQDVLGKLSDADIIREDVIENLEKAHHAMIVFITAQFDAEQEHDEVRPKIDSLLLSMRKISTKLKFAGKHPKFDQESVDLCVLKFLTVHDTHDAYAKAPSKATFLQLNKAVLSHRSQKYKTTEESAIDLLRAAIKSVQKGLYQHGLKVKEFFDSATAELTKTCDDLEKFAKGTNDGTAWNGGCAFANLKDVLKQASVKDGLLAGGAKVTNGKDAIDKAREEHFYRKVDVSNPVQGPFVLKRTHSTRRSYKYTRNGLALKKVGILLQ